MWTPINRAETQISPHLFNIQVEKLKVSIRLAVVLMIYSRSSLILLSTGLGGTLCVAVLDDGLRD